MAGKKKTNVATKKGANAAKESQAAKAAEQPKKLSALDAAVRVLGESGQAMNCQEMIEAMAAKGYWTSPGGKTPSSTLYTAVTELPNLAPGGAVSKRAWGDPVGDSDTLALDLDCFHEAANDLAAGLKAGLVETSANLVGEVLQLRDNQSQFLAAGRQICCRHSFLL